MRLDGAHVLVTGATRGLGGQIATVMAGRGARLTAVARDRTALDAIAAELQAHTIGADLSDPARLDGVIPQAEDRLGPVDVLINNAGVTAVGPLGHLEPGAANALLTTNLIAPLELARAVIPGMVTRRRGAIVNISSLAGAMAMRNNLAYGTSKAGLTMATRTLRRELRGTGIRTHLVVLGLVDTEMVTRTAEQDPVSRANVERFADKITPLDPLLVAERLADAIEKERRRDLVLPPTTAGMHYLTEVPSFLSDLLWLGLPKSYP